MAETWDGDATLTAAIVGVGGVTRAMLPALRRRPDIAIRWLVDTDLSAAEAADTSAGNTRVVASLGSLLAESKPDLVIINTPAPSHGDLAELSIRAGCHALVAKPLTTSLSTAVELVSIADSHSGTLCVGQQMRYNRHYRAVAALIGQGTIGQVESAYLLNSKPRPFPANLTESDNPALWEMSCHHFDSLASLFGERAPSWIYCDAYKPSWSAYRANSMINAVAAYENGPRLAYHAGFDARAPMYELRLDGSKGSLRCRGLHMSLPNMSYELAREDGQYAEIDLERQLLDQTADPWETFLDMWLAYVRQEGPEPPFSAKNNLKILATLEAAQCSSDKSLRAIVDLPPLGVTIEPTVRRMHHESRS